MNIVILNGSPHKKGTNVYLLDEFIRGTEVAGHQVYHGASARFVSQILPREKDEVYS